jgi:hypothetical protein
MAAKTFMTFGLLHFGLIKLSERGFTEYNSKISNLKKNQAIMNIKNWSIHQTS